MAFAAETYIGDIVKIVRNWLRNNISDPITRPADEEFIYTSYPSRTVTYPAITVKFSGQTRAQSSGQRDLSKFWTVLIEVRVWARNKKEQDNLTSSVINYLRTNIYSAGGAVENGMMDFEIDSIVPVDEEGQKGIKSNVITVQYNIEVQ